MSTNIIQISNDLLEVMYSYGFDSFYQENLENLFPSYSKTEIKKAVKEMHQKGRIHAFGIQHLRHDFFLNQFSGHITDIGILEIENFDFSNNNKFSIEIARFLEVIGEAEEEHIPTHEIVNRVISKGSRRTEQELRSLFNMVIEYTCQVQKICPIGSSEYRDLYVTNTITALTDYGYYILNLFQSSTQLFQSNIINNHDFLIKEYNNLRLLIESQLWKEVCIKMGSILEYLLTKWLRSKNISQVTHSQRSNPKNIDKASFWDKIMFYLESGRITYSNEIGDNTSWSIVNNVIREYRNYVHLEKYEERILTDGYLDKGDYDQLSPAFEQIIQYFS